MIQAWGETFLPQSHTMPLFSQTYHELRREGLPFKRQYDDQKAPILTPPATVNTSRPRRTSEADLLSSAVTSFPMPRASRSLVVMVCSKTCLRLARGLLGPCSKRLRPRCWRMLRTSPSISVPMTTFRHHSSCGRGSDLGPSNCPYPSR